MPGMTEPTPPDANDDDTFEVGAAVFFGFFLAHQRQFDAVLGTLDPQMTDRERACYRRGFTLGFLNTAQGLREAMAATCGLVTAAQFIEAYLREADTVREALIEIHAPKSPKDVQ